MSDSKRDQRAAYGTSLNDLSGVVCAVCNLAPKRADGSDAPFVKFAPPLKLVCEFCIDAIIACVRAAKTIS